MTAFDLWLLPDDEHECPDECCRCWERDVDAREDAAIERADAARKERGRDE